MSGLSMCRLCLYNTNEYLELSVDEPDEIRDTIEKFLYIEISDDDPYPRTICSKCVERLQQFHDFYLEVAQNQEILQYSQPINNVNGEPQIITITNDLTKTTTTASLIQLAPGLNLKGDNNFVVALQAAPSAAIELNLNNVIQGATIVSSSGESMHDMIANAVDKKSIRIIEASDELSDSVVHSVEPLESHGYYETITYAEEDVVLVETPKTVGQATEEVIFHKTDGTELKIEEAKHDIRSDAEVAEAEPTLDNEEKPENNGTVDVDVSTKLERELDNLQNDDIIDNMYETDDDHDDDSDNDGIVDNSAAQNHADHIDLQNEKFEGFPKQIIKDTKLLVRGKQLVQLMSKFYRLECDLCPIFRNRPKFERLGELCEHYMSNHTTKAYVICCGTKLIKPRAMAMHMARHLQPDAFKCPQCKKMLTCPKILQYHIQNHLPEEQRPLACSECPRRFSYSSALVAHAISHQPENERAAHVCDECGKSFASAGRLTSHINITHMLLGQEFICHICAKQFACRSNLTYHLTTHQPRVRQVQCEKCGKWLKNKLCLRKHMVQHSTIRYSCNACNYSALNRQCLRNHVKVHHTDVKPFGCEVCGKTFKLKNTLLNHMVQHTGIRKFSCPFCNRTFASSGNFYSHRKRMHPQELAALKLKQEEEERLLREQTLGKDGKSATMRIS